MFFNPECEASEKTRKCNWRATRVIPMGTGFHRSHKLDVSHFDNPEIEKLLRDKNGVCMKNSYDFGIIDLEKTVKCMYSRLRDQGAWPGYGNHGFWIQIYH